MNKQIHKRTDLEVTTRSFNFEPKAIGRLSEKRGDVGTEVYHKNHLTPDNVNNPEISLNQDNPSMNVVTKSMEDLDVRKNINLMLMGI